MTMLSKPLFHAHHISPPFIGQPEIKVVQWDKLWWRQGIVIARELKQKLAKSLFTDNRRGFQNEKE